MTVIPAGDSILDAIGNTGVVELARIRRRFGLRGRIFAKLEHLQPGLTKKTRVALYAITSARREGLLTPTQPVVEATSGNTGTGLAIVCGALGHPLTVFMSTGNSAERSSMMRALGARVVLVEQVDGQRAGHVTGRDIEAVEEAARDYARDQGAFYMNQFENEANAEAHYRGTGPEFWQQTNGELDAFVQFTGTGGAFAGCVRYFKEQNPGLRAYVVEPAGSRVLAGREIAQPHHSIQGGGYGKPELKLLPSDLVDGFLAVADEEAIQFTRLLARDEGIFAGPSSGANLAAAVNLMTESPEPLRVGLLVCDSGMKYLSTGLFDCDGERHDPGSR